MLREQAALYRRLEAFAAKQRTLISSEEAGPLLMLLADRQRLSVQLAGISQRFEPIRREWNAHRERLTPLERREAEGLLSDIKDHLSRVMESDEQDARILSARKESVATALRASHATGQAISAYRSSPAVASTVDRWDATS